MHSWELVSGVFTLIFLLMSFYFLIVACIKDFGKRGWLFIAALITLGPAFLFDLIHSGFGNEAAEVLSHGLVQMAGILFLLSFYLSNRELRKKDRGVAQ